MIKLDHAMFWRIVTKERIINEGHILFYWRIPFVIDFNTVDKIELDFTQFPGDWKEWKGQLRWQLSNTKYLPIHVLKIQWAVWLFYKGHIYTGVKGTNNLRKNFLLI